VALSFISMLVFAYSSLAHILIGPISWLGAYSF
jgi:hypothetical protein